MNKAVWFWLIMFLWLISSIYMGWPRQQPLPTTYYWADALLIWLLLFILGWACLGSPIQ